MWTQFMDMHSGGGCKEDPYEYIYIEAPRDEARIIFYNRFGHNPERVSCTCCGEDYSISSSEFLSQVTGYERRCRTLQTPRLPNRTFDNDNPVIKKHLYLEADEAVPEGFKLSEFPPIGEYQSLKEYIEKESVLFIHASEIKLEERKGEVPEQGYVWKD